MDSLLIGEATLDHLEVFLFFGTVGFFGVVTRFSRSVKRFSILSIASRNDAPPLFTMFASTTETAFSILRPHLTTGRTRVCQMMPNAPTTAPAVMIHCAAFTGLHPHRLQQPNATKNTVRAEHPHRHQEKNREPFDYCPGLGRDRHTASNLAGLSAISGDSSKWSQRPPREPALS